MVTVAPLQFWPPHNWVKLEPSSHWAFLILTSNERDRFSLWGSACCSRAYMSGKLRKMAWKTKLLRCSFGKIMWKVNEGNT